MKRGNEQLKGRGSMDYLLLLPAILYYCIAILGFFVCIPVAVNRWNFGGTCILYADFVKGFEVRKFGQMYIKSKGRTSICDFPIYFGVVGMIICGAVAGSVYMYFAIKSRKDKYVGERMWVVPFISLNGILTFITMVTACVLTVGYKVSCSSLKKALKSNGCGQLQNITMPDGSNTGPYVMLSTFSEAGAWIGFLLYMIQTGMSAFRLYRNRLRQK